MPRRRLHGETQARRKKKRTRLLKRQGSITRPESTQQAAPFEKTPHPEREDLEFLESMREMDVRRAPWGREAPIRRENAERVRFLAENEERDMFMEKMKHLDVRPLQAGKTPAGEKSRAPSSRPEDGELPLPLEGGEGDTGRNGRRLTAAHAPPPVLSSTTSPAAESTPSHPRPPLEEGASTPVRNTVPEKNTVPERNTVPENEGRPEKNTAPEITRFETPPAAAEDEAPAAAMEALMAGEEFDPSLKFAGAVTPPPGGRGEAGRRFSEDAEPDEELDLHGKTQEEAIRMVQNFLLVSHRQKLRHVLIITGKGNNSGQGGPVLGRAVFHWLERNGDRYVRDFIQAPPRMGGAGAIWITLR